MVERVFQQSTRVRILEEVKEMLRLLGKRFTVIAVVMVILAVSGVATVMAGNGILRSNPNSDPFHNDAVTHKAAAILGIEFEELAGALKQARVEVQREAEDVRVSRRVSMIAEARGLTEEEADAVILWWQERPAAVNFSLLAKAYWPHYGPDLVLSPLLANERITPEEADAIRLWWDLQPDSLDLSLILPGKQNAKRYYRSRR